MVVRDSSWSTYFINSTNVSVFFQSPPPVVSVEWLVISKQEKFAKVSVHERARLRASSIKLCNSASLGGGTGFVGLVIAKALLAFAASETTRGSIAPELVAPEAESPESGKVVSGKVESGIFES